MGIVVATEMWVAWYFLERFGKKILRRNALIRILLAASLLILFTALARAFILLSFNPYLIPLAGLSILGTMLLGPRLMFLMVVITSVNVGIIAGNDFFLDLLPAARIGLRHLHGLAGQAPDGASASRAAHRPRHRRRDLRGRPDRGRKLRCRAAGRLGLGNGLLSLMLAMVLLPLLERRLQHPHAPEAPRALRSRQAPPPKAPARGARDVHSLHAGRQPGRERRRADRGDPLLARVGSYYHDIGKLYHPNYFIENQISRMNPHTTLTPGLSARIIKRHVKDGVELGREWNLPDEVLDMIAEHHGTTRIEYFYRKALEEAVTIGASVSEADFRYPGPRSKSKEAGILMLADSIEATVKSLEKPTPKRIEDIVKGTIRAKLEDGQFDECELTMREIHETGEAILEVLIGIIGPRIEYPEPPSEGPNGGTVPNGPRPNGPHPRAAKNTP